MCGISGFAAGDGNGGYLSSAQVQRQRLLRMAQCLGRRGPDDSGIYLREGVGFAHTRLSIIDLSGGNQPMVRESGG